MSRDRFHIGTVIRETPSGQMIRRAIALVVQRRQSENGKVETQIVGCPLCGGFHEHGAGAGPRVPHCFEERDGMSEYEVLDAGHLPVVPYRLSRLRIGRGKYM